MAQVLDDRGHGGVRVHPDKVILNVAGVHDHEVDARLQPVHNQVINDAAQIIAHQCILGLANRDVADVVREQIVQRAFRVRSGHEKLAHVRNIEQSNPLADRRVLLQDPRVLHRHFPTAERHHFRTPFEVRGVQRRALEQFGAVHGGVTLTGG